MSLDPNVIRQQFPSLNRPDIFFDNPGGTQIAKQSLNRINRYLIECNANHEGAFATSIASDTVLDEAHRQWLTSTMLRLRRRLSLATI
jgi:selenocysteine lyase/cysteine desulfurase